MDAGAATIVTVPDVIMLTSLHAFYAAPALTAPQLGAARREKHTARHTLVRLALALTLRLLCLASLLVLTKVLHSRGKGFNARTGLTVAINGGFRADNEACLDGPGG